MVKRKRKTLRFKLTKEQLRDMMENRLRAKTIPSGKIYKRKKTEKD